MVRVLFSVKQKMFEFLFHHLRPHNFAVPIHSLRRFEVMAVVWHPHVPHDNCHVTWICIANIFIKRLESVELLCFQTKSTCDAAVIHIRCVALDFVVA